MKTKTRIEALRVGRGEGGNCPTHHIPLRVFWVKKNRGDWDTYCPLCNPEISFEDIEWRAQRETAKRVAA